MLLVVLRGGELCNCGSLTNGLWNQPTMPRAFSAERTELLWQQVSTICANQSLLVMSSDTAQNMHQQVRM